MGRPRSTELTDRELAVMQVFWHQSEATAENVREFLLGEGEKLAYVTVANVVRGLLDKGFLEQTHRERPYRYSAVRSFNDVSNRLIGDFVKRLFDGSREAMLVHVLRQRKLSETERMVLAQVLKETEHDSNVTSEMAQEVDHKATMPSMEASDVK